MLKIFKITILTGAVLLAGLTKWGWSAMWDCGPPEMVIVPKGGGKGWISTTNLTSWQSYSSATSSGTSDCDVFFGLVLQEKKELEQQKYILASWEDLSEETAKGGGPHIYGLATLMGCPDGHNQIFAEMLRKDYDSLFFEAFTKSKAPAKLRTRINSLIERHPQLVNKCNLEG